MLQLNKSDVRQAPQLPCPAINANKTYLLLSRLPDWRRFRNITGVCWHCAPAVFLEKVERPVQQVPDVIGQSCIDNVSEALFRKVPILQGTGCHHVSDEEHSRTTMGVSSTFR